MAVKSSGSLSIATDIVGEFADVAPHTLSEFYKGAGKVPDVPDNASVPDSGAISMSDFYDAVNAVYMAATGGTIVTDGDYKYHTFTTSGTFTVTQGGNSAGSNSVDALVLAGGGSGGAGIGGGGGGAGGFLEVTGAVVTAQAYTITVGAGGSSPAHNTAGNSGSNSVFDTYQAIGGGAGGSGDVAVSGTPYGGAQEGGSGGGPSGDGTGSISFRAGTSGQGNSSGSHTGGSSPYGPRMGMGGGGADTAGSQIVPGDGKAWLDGVVRGGGGAGGVSDWNATGVTATGGAGGGGQSSQYAPSAGATNKGAGGGGCLRTGAGGAGGSGVVILRYKFQN